MLNTIITFEADFHLVIGDIQIGNMNAVVKARITSLVTWYKNCLISGLFLEGK
jgi:hypothetical protein